MNYLRAKPLAPNRRSPANTTTDSMRGRLTWEDWGVEAHGEYRLGIQPSNSDSHAGIHEGFTVSEHTTDKHHR